MYQSKMKSEETDHLFKAILSLKTEEVDLWCSQHTTSAFKLGEPVYRLVRGKTAYELPDMKQVGWKIKDRLQKDLRGTSFEVHSNLRFKI